MSHRSVLIFSGNNQRAIIAFCRYADQEGISFLIVANGQEDTIFQSAYSTRIVSIREKNRLELGDLFQFCERIKEIHQVEEIFILPSTEFLNRFLLANKKILFESGIHFGLCEESIYSLISDKFSFSLICESKGIPVPNVYPELPCRYPYVIKPKAYGNHLSKMNEKPILILSEEGLKKTSKIENLSDYYFQEYIDGPSYYLLYHFSKSGQVVAYSQENLIQQDEGASMILARSSIIHNQEISKQFISLFDEIKFHGLVMVEVKFDGNKLVMIEANPRLWGPSQLILNAGMTIFDAFSFDNGLKSDFVEKEYREGEYYFWSGGIIENFKAGKKPRFYNFEMSKFYSDYHLLTKSDIYLQKDTITIYFNEVS